MALQFLAWFLEKVRRRVGLYGLAAVGLLFGSLILVIVSLTRIVRGLETERSWLYLIGFVAVSLGWWGGNPKRNPWRLWLFALITGAIAVIFHAGRLWAGAWAVARTLSVYLWMQGQASVAGLGSESQEVVDLWPVYNSLTLNWKEFWGALTKVLSPLGAWFQHVLTGDVAYDRVVMVILWSGGVLWMAFWAGWFLRRWGRPLVALFPAGVVLAGCFSYVRQESVIGLAGFVGLVLLLTGLHHQYQQEKKWQNNHMDYAEDLRLDALGSASGLTLLAVIVALLVPIINFRQFVDFFQTPATGNATDTREVGESLGLSLPEAPPSPFEPVETGGLPRLHLLGSGPELSEQLVMVVEVDDPLAETSPRYYWRSLTYDTYTGQGWTTPATTSIPYPAGAVALPTGGPPRVVRQHVRLTGETRTFIFSAGDILSVDGPFTLAWRAPPEEERFADQFAGLVNETEYQVDAFVPFISAAQLRTHTAPLPEWVRARYLALPEGIPARVFDLAAGVTIAQPTPFDRAVALERFLRSFPYSLALPEPPPDQDVVDYFLFDVRRGYCDYYATAMVVLARASGLPARLAVGYASGTYDPVNERYLVTEADAHSWVEIYFAEVGWVAFEPTGGQPELTRTDSPAGEGVTSVVPPPPFEPGWKRGARGVVWGLVGVFLLGLGGFAGWNLWENWRFRHLSPDEMVARLFGRLHHAGARLNIQARPGSTPYEFAAVFSFRIEALSVPGRFFALPQGEAAYMVREVWALADYFVRAAYAPEPLTVAERTEALKLWRDLRWRLWGMGWRMRWVKLFSLVRLR
ncbi:MAG: transglutaminase domain-containing protein [Anaerolineales bacterium]|nr:transglutaminase domain-containing protein [Anaerolineales bacterium]